MGKDTNDFFMILNLGDLAPKLYAITGLNAFNFILQVDYLFNIQFALFILSTFAACKTNNCCEKKSNINIYVSNKNLSELPQQDFYLPVNEPDNFTLSNIIEISTTEIKKVQKSNILKRKAHNQIEVQDDQ